MSATVRNIMTARVVAVREEIQGDGRNAARIPDPDGPQGWLDGVLRHREHEKAAIRHAALTVLAVNPAMASPWSSPSSRPRAVRGRPGVPRPVAGAGLVRSHPRGVLRDVAEPLPQSHRLIQQP
jgi:hypothetical protein